jgi:hypothetical protein
LGPKVAKVLQLSDPEIMRPGSAVMPWQRDALDVACEIDPATGLFWYRTVILIVPRQAGKTSLSRGKITHRCLTDPGKPVLYTAQDRNKALRRLKKDFYEPLARSPLAAQLGRPRWAAGSEAVRWVNGSEIFIDAAQKKTAGHGETLAEAHLDEAFAHIDSRLDQAVSPMMITVRGAQKWITSAAGDTDSRFLWGKVEAGRARVLANAHDPQRLTESRTCYIEYSAPADADRDDPATWEAAHPAVGFTIDLETLQSEHDDLEPPSEFDRAYLGWWPTAKPPPQIIPATAWEAGILAPGEEPWEGVPVWSVDMSPDREWSAIGMVAKAATRGRVFGEVIKHDLGTSWIVESMVRLRAAVGGDVVALDGSGAASSLGRDLEDEGFTIRRLSTREKVDACGALFDDVLDGKFVHLNDPVLNGALAAAAKRNMSAGDGGFMWIRGKSLQDITPLYTVTLARYVWAEFTPYDPLDNIF